MDGSNGPAGHTLGGSSVGGHGLSADEIRRRRLAAFGGSDPVPVPTAGTTQSSKANNMNEDSRPAQAQKNSISKFIEVKNNNIDDDDDEDADLQAALALSLEKHDAASDVKASVEEVEAKFSTFNALSSQQHKASPVSGDLMEEWWKTGVALDISSFHTFMWDSGLTTDNDKSRWVRQGIDTRAENRAGSCNGASAISAGAGTGAGSGAGEKSAGAVAGTGKKSQTLSGTEGDGLSAKVSELVSDHKPWGLTQTHGGPCGVLAAVQAELLRLLLFSKRNPLDYPQRLDDTLSVSSTSASAANTANINSEQAAPQNITEELITEALAKAIAIILARAAIMPSAFDEEEMEPRSSVNVVLPIKNLSLTWDDLEPWHVSKGNTPVKSGTLKVYTISPVDSTIPSTKRQKTNGDLISHDVRIVRLARAVTEFLLEAPPSSISGGSGSTDITPTPLEAFRRPGGVLLLVMSLVSSRGQQIIQNEMDDPTGSTLTAQFGHCGQELINLLLTGQAVSNVFDNTLTPSGELTCRGIQSRPTIGYLSQLEALRYCEVGGYYKSPRFPIWVVGSTSHFTVLFGDASCLKETASDLLLEKCRRAFKAVEGGEENGFISSQNLGTVIKALDLDIGGDAAVQTLSASLEVSEAGIILWDDFWKATSRLLTGASLDHILQGSEGGLGQDDEHPPLLMIGDGDFDQKPSSKESDEEIAKRLSSEYDYYNQERQPQNEQKLLISNTLHQTTQQEQQLQQRSQQQVVRIASPMQVEPNSGLSDEEFARKLQAEWDAELAGQGGNGADGATVSSVVAIDGSPPSPHWKDNQLDSVSEVSVLGQSIATSATPNNVVLEFEKYGDSFSLYHYNGLRGGTLTNFRVTRLSAEEAVGASIALNRGGTGNGFSAAVGGGSGDLEDVVRTKWPSCMINWLGKSPPYID